MLEIMVKFPSNLSKPIDFPWFSHPHRPGLHQMCQGHGRLQTVMDQPSRGAQASQVAGRLEPLGATTFCTPFVEPRWKTGWWLLLTTLKNMME